MRVSAHASEAVGGGGGTSTTKQVETCLFFWSALNSSVPDIQNRSPYETARSETGDPLLLTPGPLTISAATKQAMQHDYGSRDDRIIGATRWIREQLVDVVHGGDDYQCVLVQGSGTFAVEATLGTLVPRGGKVLILVNGEYGRRMTTICNYQRRAFTTLETTESVPVDPIALDEALTADPDVTHVAVVYCETTTGLLNPLGDVAAVTEAHNRSLIVDAMSAFGVLPLDVSELRVQAVVGSANKCLEGPPGFAFSIIRTDALRAAEGNAPSLSLDLHAQWLGFERDGQWRFTPPTHVLLGFEHALREFHAEGAVEGRGSRYRRNCEVLIEGMGKIGLETFIEPHLQAPIIVTFRTPDDPAFDFVRLYQLLRSSGYVIYPGKLTEVDTFRIGCIGRLNEDDMRGVVAATGRALRSMGVPDRPVLAP